MINWNILKAMIAGISVLIIAQVLYIGVLVKINHHEPLRLALLIVPALAAFTAAYLSPRKKVIVGMSMALFGAIIAMLSTYLYEYFGLKVDSIGGLVATFFIIFAYHVVLNILGSVAGWYLSRKESQGS